MTEESDNLKHMLEELARAQKQLEENDIKLKHLLKLQGLINEAGKAEHDDFSETLPGETGNGDFKRLSSDLLTGEGKDGSNIWDS